LVAIDTTTFGPLNGFSAANLPVLSPLDFHCELNPLVLVALIVIIRRVPSRNVIVHHDDLGEAHCLRVEHEWLRSLRLTSRDELLLSLVWRLGQVGLGLVRSEVETVLLRWLHVLRSELLVLHRRELLLGELLLREWLVLRGTLLIRYLAVRCHGLIPGSSEHSVPPPRDEKDAHDTTKCE